MPTNERDERDLEKTITQIFDMLPDILKRVNNLSEYADKFHKAFAAVKPKKGILEKQLGRKKEFNETSYMIAELIQRLDRLYPGSGKPRRLLVARKELQRLSEVLMKSADKISTALGKAAKRKMPNPLKRFGADLFKEIGSMVKGTKHLGHLINLDGGIISFAYYMEITGKGDKSVKRKAFVVVSQDFDRREIVFKPIKMAVFQTEIPLPPYVPKDPRLAGKTNVHFVKSLKDSVNLALSILDVLGFGNIIKKRPYASRLKPSRRILEELEESYPRVEIDGNAIKLAVRRKDWDNEKTMKQMLIDARKVFLADKRKLIPLHDPPAFKSLISIGDVVMVRIRFYPRELAPYIRFTGLKKRR
jgi:hypothetical protein